VALSTLATTTPDVEHGLVPDAERVIRCALDDFQIQGH
jgi:hypothetical protein